MNSSPLAGPWLCRAFIGTLSGVLVLGATGPAHAQGTISNNPSVVVDLGVLDALGPARSTSVLSPTTTPSPSPAPAVSTRGLLEPPAAAPVSRLNVPTPTSPDRPPRPAAAPTQAVATSEPVPVAAPEPPAAPTVEAPTSGVQTAGRSSAADPPAPTPTPTAPNPIASVPSQSTPVVPAPARAELRQPTQVPEPPKPPEAPAVTPEPPPAPVVSAPPPVAEEPAVEPAAPAGPQVAARSSAEAAPELRLQFEAGSARLPDSGRQPLQQLATKLDAEGDMRVQLRAYAGGTAETSSLARRLSLSRALAVRSYLIEQGVRSTRMDVRALGNKSGEGPADRVDIVLVAQ